MAGEEEKNVVEPRQKECLPGKAALNRGSYKYSEVISPHNDGALWEGLKDMRKHCNMQRTRPVQRRC